MERREKITAEEILNDNIPDWILWQSILSSFEACTDNRELEKLASEMKQVLPAMKPRVHAEFKPGIDRIDNIAQKDIPPDGPVTFSAVETLSDGNCLCRALSKAFYNTDEMHVELRVRILIEAILNKNMYLSDDCLERGASYLHRNADLPTVFATFSEFYTPGQKLSEDTILCIYSLELYSCAKMSSYMGLWQLAQSSSVLGVPIHTVYPIRGNSTIRNDFHRMFFPVEYPTQSDDEPVVIMWTGMRKGGVPIHFVPLLKNSQ